MDAYGLGQVPVYFVKPSVVRHSSFENEFNSLYIIDIYHRVDTLGESHKVVQGLELAANQHEK